jgi:hypothetical protein
MGSILFFHILSLKWSSFLFLETGEKPKFLPFLAGAAAGTILDKLSGKTNTVSANGDYQSEGKYVIDLFLSNSL